MEEQGGTRARQVLVGTLKWTVFATALTIVVFLGTNAFDEDLSPEARGLLVTRPNPLKPEQNLYVVLLGLQAPPGESPVTVGLARVAAYEKDTALALKDPRHAPRALSDPDGYRENKLEFRGKVDFCQPFTSSCFTDVERHRSEIDRLLKVNRELYRRYIALHDVEGFRELPTPSLYVLLGYAPRAVRQLYIANIALKVKTGARSEQQDAIRDLLQDIKTWRIQLRESRWLISKFIAVANVQVDYALLADIIGDRRMDLGGSAQAIRSALDLPEEDWKTGELFPSEYGLTVFMLEQMRAAGGGYGIMSAAAPGDPGWSEELWGRLARLAFKVNATQNLDAASKVRLRQVGNAAPRDFFAARDAYRKWMDDNVGFGLHYVYNPVGKLLMSLGTNAFEGYPLRAYDGAAFQRLVRLGYEIRARRIGDEAVPAFMQQNLQWSSHPVDGRLFAWDPKKREIRVQTLGPQPKDRRFGIPVWSGSPG